jgi:hypothetical protein
MESMNVQAKLTVSDPNDVYEQEADRVAEEVTKAVQTPVSRQVEEEEPVMPFLQRQEEEELQMQGEEEIIQDKLDVQRQVPEQKLGNTPKVEAVQRMVVAATDNLSKITDPLVWNNLEWAKSQAGGPIGDLDNNRHWEDVDPGEDVRIVGHGKPGSLTAETTTPLAPATDYNAAKIAASMKKDDLHEPDTETVLSQITFQSCYAGAKKPDNTSLIKDMSDELRDMGQSGVEVTGSTGIAFGFKGMGEATAIATTGTYVFTQPALIRWFNSLSVDKQQKFNDGSKAYIEARYIHRNHKTKSGQKIFERVLKYSAPHILANCTEVQWGAMTTKKKTKQIADEMEPYWKDIKTTMTALGGFETDADKAIKSFTSQ